MTNNQQTILVKLLQESFQHLSITSAWDGDAIEINGQLTLGNLKEIARMWNKYLDLIEEGDQ